METPEIKNTKEWRLKHIAIDLQKFGANKGKYCGNITFENDEFENFTFNIPPDMATRYLQLMANDLVTAAAQLTIDLLKTLPK